MAAPRRSPRDAAAMLGAYGCAAIVAATLATAASRHAGELQQLLVQLLVALLVATLVVFAFSVAADNASMYDPFWSVAPLGCLLFWAVQAPAGSGHRGRQALAAACVAAWSLRLTANFWRRWRGLRHEDWRYADLRRAHPRLYWPISLLGVHLLPTLLVYLGCLPLCPIFVSPRAFSALDVAAAGICIVAIGIEALADEQLARHARRRGADARSAVLVDGLWRVRVAYCAAPSRLFPPPHAPVPAPAWMARCSSRAIQTTSVRSSSGAACMCLPSPATCPAGVPLRSRVRWRSLRSSCWSPCRWSSRSAGRSTTAGRSAARLTAGRAARSGSYFGTPRIARTHDERRR